MPVRMMLLMAVFGKGNQWAAHTHRGKVHLTADGGGAHYWLSGRSLDTCGALPHSAFLSKRKSISWLDRHQSWGSRLRYTARGPSLMNKRVQQNKTKQQVVNANDTCCSAVGHSFSIRVSHWKWSSPQSDQCFSDWPWGKRIFLADKFCQTNLLTEWLQPKLARVRHPAIGFCSVVKVNHSIGHGTAAVDRSDRCADKSLSLSLSPPYLKMCCSALINLFARCQMAASSAATDSD